MQGPLLLIGNWVNQITSNFLYKITHLVRSVLKLADLDTRTPSEFLLKHFKLLGKKGQTQFILILMMIKIMGCGNGKKEAVVHLLAGGQKLKQMAEDSQHSF